MARATRRRVASPQGAHVREPAPGGAPSADESVVRAGSRTALGAGLAPPGRSRNPFGFARRLQPRFVADVLSELRKVTWPTFAETRYLTLVVAVVSVAIGLLLGGLDLIFGWAVERLFF